MYAWKCPPSFKTMKFSTGIESRLVLGILLIIYVEFHSIAVTPIFVNYRSFDCMRIGDKGVKIVRPDDPDFQQKPGTDAEIDAGGYDDVEDYDENAVVRRRRKSRRL